MNFGQRVRALRKAKQMTLPELSKRAKIGLGTLSRYERQRATGRIAHTYLQRLADALEVDLAFLTDDVLGSAGASATDVAAREALKRFLATHDDLPKRTLRGLQRVQDDRAAPKTIDRWVDFWRLVQILSGKDSPLKAMGPTARLSRTKKPILRMIPGGSTESVLRTPRDSSPCPNEWATQSSLRSLSASARYTAAS